MNDMSQWLRLYTDILENRKVQKLPPELFKGWINLLALTKENDGLLPSIEDVAFRLRMSDEQAESLVEALVERGLLDSDGERLTPHNWDGRQYMDTTAAERAKRYRANRDASQQRHDTVTAESQQRHGEITLSDTETEAESESETEQIQSQSRAEAEPEPSRAKPRSVRKPVLCDDAYLVELQASPAYATLDVRQCYYKASEWCRVNGRHLTQRFFVNWLNREKPMTAKVQPPRGNANVGKSPPPPAVIADPVETESYMSEYVDDLISREDFIQLGNEYDAICQRGGAKAEWEIAVVAWYELHRNERATPEQMASLNASIRALPQL